MVPHRAPGAAHPRLGNDEVVAVPHEALTLRRRKLGASDALEAPRLGVDSPLGVVVASRARLRGLLLRGESKVRAVLTHALAARAGARDDGRVELEALLSAEAAGVAVAQRAGVRAAPLRGEHRLALVPPNLVVEDVEQRLRGDVDRVERRIEEHRVREDETHVVRKGIDRGARLGPARPRTCRGAPLSLRGGKVALRVVRVLKLVPHEAEVHWFLHDVEVVRAVVRVRVDGYIEDSPDVVLVVKHHVENGGEEGAEATGPEQSNVLLKLPALDVVDLARDRVDRTQRSAHVRRKGLLEEGRQLGGRPRRRLGAVRNHRHRALVRRCRCRRRCRLCRGRGRGVAGLQLRGAAARRDAAHRRRGVGALLRPRPPLHVPTARLLRRWLQAGVGVGVELLLLQRCRSTAAKRGTDGVALRAAVAAAATATRRCRCRCRRGGRRLVAWTRRRARQRHPRRLQRLLKKTFH